ncbi:hypothetical protein AQ490_18160 [Wenjunlia vitaminophila]|uniref:Uncharacterized protein n=1 Tax=Wenjunlia vitaminophila TaxID=76728 RepID=A0A0T6LV38_WENVI|nr:hypothetical protein [Wenjunlia vitaminophila]KRV49981.1 hypothetical protein AQ490_18160 [Wenjunlia vitaminophila]
MSVLGRGDLVAVPPVWLTHGPGPHWRVPFSADAHLTDQDRLRGALAAAMGRLGAPEADDALTGLSAAQRARRNAVLSARLREVNHRSVTREVRPW